MKPSELLHRVRKRLFDEVGSRHTQYWSDYELLVDYGNVALDKFFLGVRKLIIDSNTLVDLAGLPLCSVSLSAGKSVYPMSPKIIEIDAAQITVITDPVNQVTLVKPMAVMTVGEMDQRYRLWRSIQAGDPRVIITDMNSDSLTVWPTPELTDTTPALLLTPTISLTVRRFMLQRFDMVKVGSEYVPDDNVALTFREEYHESLIPGILAEAYMKDDGETKRLDLAAANEKKFEAKIESAKEDLTHRMQVNRGVKSRLAFR